MTTYETTFILDPGLDETRVNAEIDKVTQWIKDGGGEVVDLQRWGKRRLAYEINKKRDGIYTFIMHASPGEVIKDIEHRLRLNESVMRVLSVVHVPESLLSATGTSDDDDSGDDDSDSDDRPSRPRGRARESASA